jgi:hypothetical protein
LLKSKKHWRSWLYGIHLWQYNICHKVWKFSHILKNYSCGWNFWVNLCYSEWYWYTWIKSRTICKSIVLGWNLEFIFWGHIFSNKCIIISSYYEKTIAIWNMRKFYKSSLHYFFTLHFFCNVSWTTNMKPHDHQKIISYIFFVHWFDPILSI